ncbi:hypothetical protein K505DRAFT_347096 [Melanomma pulvis-pyrius CBS 109.77]|uniref:Mid2 domain-containing protein n=1 Tax=Melanomma pulvis-pyrius CBS 109.77 TaxID=1314802 RepID=A0A6A6XMC8_9PLEO|nr:hypothetical protein K505DRAFT_347096 [Melanomma pulvis-pyrius CBS 109.77]
MVLSRQTTYTKLVQGTNSRRAVSPAKGTNVCQMAYATTRAQAMTTYSEALVRTRHGRARSVSSTATAETRPEATIASFRVETTDTAAAQTEAHVAMTTRSTASNTLPIATPTDIGTDANTSVNPTNTESKSKATATGSGSASKASNTAAAATSTSSPTDTPSPSKTPIIAGAAGGIVILLAATGLVWFFVRRRYRKKLAAGSNAFPLSSDGFQKLPDKTPRPVEVPAPLHSPAPPYQPPAYTYGAPPPLHNAVEIDESYRVPERNQYGQPVYEAPAHAYGL